jgi:hypothetical protein
MTTFYTYPELTRIYLSMEEAIATEPPAQAA